MKTINTIFVQVIVRFTYFGRLLWWDLKPQLPDYWSNALPTSYRISSLYATNLPLASSLPDYEPRLQILSRHRNIGYGGEGVGT